MKKSRLLGAVCACLSLLGIISTVYAALVSRLGGLAYYDDTLKITWTANADVNGLMNWTEANTWVDNLTIGGKGGWRLPSVGVDGNGTVVDCSTASEADCRDNELAYMFYQNGVNTTTQAPFSDLLGAFYWSETVFETTPVFRAWIFEFASGFLLADGQALDTHGAWAVYNGDISAVPVPAGVWLFGSGLLGLIGIARPRKT